MKNQTAAFKSVESFVREVLIDKLKQKPSQATIRNVAKKVYRAIPVKRDEKTV